MPPLPLPIRLIRSSSEKLRGVGRSEDDDDDDDIEAEDGAELGGRGRGTANIGSRCGRGRVRSSFLPRRLRLADDPVEDAPAAAIADEEDDGDEAEAAGGSG